MGQAKWPEPFYIGFFGSYWDSPAIGPPAVTHELRLWLGPGWLVWTSQSAAAPTLEDRDAGCRRGVPEPVQALGGRRHLGPMNIMDDMGREPVPGRSWSRKMGFAEELGSAFERGARRFLVVGGPGSRCLSRVVHVLRSRGIRAVVIDLRDARTREDLDAAMRRDVGSRDFYWGMRKLIRHALRSRLAIIFHGMDSSMGSPGGDPILYRVWCEVRSHCGPALVLFTASDPSFPEYCFRRFEPCRSLVYLIRLPGSKAPVRQPVGGRVT